MKLVLCLSILMAVAVVPVFAVEANMCVYCSDLCCDANPSTQDYWVPAGTQVSRTYIHYEGLAGNEVTVECWRYVGLNPTEFLWSVTDLCGCGTTYRDTQQPISQNQGIRFKVKCTGCNSENCNFGSTAVYFYTSATAASCPPECPKN